MESRYKRLGKNTFLVFIGSVGSKLITFLMLPFYTHYLSIAEYGISDMVLTYSSIFTSFVFCCITDAIFIFPKGKPNYDKSKYFTSGLYFAFLSLLVWGFVVAGISLINSTSVIVLYSWWILGMSASMFFQSYVQNFALASDKMLAYTSTSIVQVVTTAILAVVLLPSLGLRGYMLSLILSNLVGTIYSFFVAKSYEYCNSHNYDKLYLKELLVYGFPLIPNSIMWWLVNGVNRPIMEVELGLDAVGIYGVANRIPSVIVILFTVFMNAWNISMIEEFGKPDFNAFFNKIARVIFFVLVFGAGVLVFGSKLLVSLLAAPEYYEAWRYVPILSIALVFQCMSSMVGGVFSAEKKSKYFFYSSIWGALVSLVMTYLLVNCMGLMGVAVALVCSFGVMLLVRIRYAWKHINMFNYKYYILIIILLLFTSYIYIRECRWYWLLLTAIFYFSIIVYTNRRYLKYILSAIQEYLANTINKK